MLHRWVFSPWRLGSSELVPQIAPFLSPFLSRYLSGSPPVFFPVPFWGQFTLLYISGYPPTSLGVSVTLIRFTPFIPLSCECHSSHFLRSDFSPLIPSLIFGNCTRVHPLVPCGFSFRSFILAPPFSFCLEASCGPLQL